MNRVVRRLVSFIFALVAGSTLFAEPTDKPVGRSIAQRFGPIDQSLVYNPGQTGVSGRQVPTDNAQTKAFQYEDHTTTAKFETRQFPQEKRSWLSKLMFWTKDADVASKHEIPNTTRQIDTKAMAVKDARDADRSAAVRALPGADRTYLGPERAKLDRSVDPTKPLPGWAGDKLEPLTLEEVRELLNKNK